LTKLFEGIKKDRTNADIGWMLNKAPFYNEGYKTAARELTVNYGDRHTNEKDTLVFPIVFLYRQYLELTLKDIIRELYRKLGYNINDKILSQHKLFESPRVCERLNNLRNWNYEKIKSLYIRIS